MDTQQIKLEIFSRLLAFFGTCIFSGFICGLIGSLFFWVNTKALLHELESGRSLFSLVFLDGVMIGIPIGLSVGIATGLHHAIFGQNSPKAILWATISGTGTLSGLWFTQFTTNNYPILFEVTFIGLMVGLIMHWYITKNSSPHPKATPQKIFFALSLVTGLLFVFLPVYAYFRFWLSLTMIPS